MHAQERRQEIFKAPAPIRTPHPRLGAGGALFRHPSGHRGRHCAAALQRRGYSEPRGYCIQGAAPGLVRRVAVRHTPHRMETELNIMVDNGCTVVDVIVEHPLYGQLTGSLQLSTRAEVEQFMARSLTTQPLSALTGGIHLHTLLCPDEAAFQRVREALRQEDILLED